MCLHVHVRDLPSPSLLRHALTVKFGVEANLKDIVVVRRKGKLALARIFFAIYWVPA